jgi:hypothetical protein
MKNSDESIRNRSRDLPVYSAVPQSNASPRASNKLHIQIHIHISTLLHVSAADLHRYGATNTFETQTFSIPFVVLKYTALL